MRCLNFRAIFKTYLCYKLKKNFRFYGLLFSICLFYIVFIYTNNYDEGIISSIDSNIDSFVLSRGRNDLFLKNLLEKTSRKTYDSNIDINIVKNKNEDIIYDQNDENQKKNLKMNPKYEKCEPIDQKYIQYTVELDGQIYPKNVLPHANKSINFACINGNPNASTKVILSWNDWWGKFYGFGKKTPFEANYCPVTDCEFTDDKSRLNESDLVIVHGLDPILDVPSFRPANQRWVFFFYESPFYSTNVRGLSNNIFNFTSTYRKNSDFPGFYEASSLFYWEYNPDFDENFDFFGQKTKFAAIVITRYDQNDMSGRFAFINELKKYIQVDVYYPYLTEPTENGLPCPKSFKDNRPINLLYTDHVHHGICKEVIASEYKFYLAFENSICDQYITEEFFSILRRNIVPVVIGSGPYDYFVPKSAYINSLDYNTPKDLADYLLLLNGNSLKYNSFFKWKKHIKTIPYSLNISPLCDMCIKLHLEHYYGVEKKIRDNVEADWSIDQNCEFLASNETKFFNFINGKN